MTDCRRNNTLAVWLMVTLVLLPIAYVLALGPATYLLEGSKSPLVTYVLAFYQPLLWLGDACQPFGDVLDSYVLLWQ